VTSAALHPGIRLLLGAALLLMAPTSARSYQGTGESVRRTTVLMGTTVRIEVEAGGRGAALAASEAALRAMVQLERQISTWDAHSQLSLLGHAPVGQVTTATPEVARLLAEVARWADRTGGAFHPVVGALIDAWDLRGSGRHPSSAEVQEALSATGDRGGWIERESGALIRYREGAWVDAGGFGKGAALRTARDTLAARGVRSAIIDLGGQLVVFGDTALSVSVAHPSDRARAVLSLCIADASVATSGQSERNVVVDGQRFGHILDPRMGQPVPPWGSVTVVARDPLVADILSTAFFVLGPEAGMMLADSLADVGVLFLQDSDGALTRAMNPRMAQILGQTRINHQHPPGL